MWCVYINESSGQLPFTFQDHLQLQEQWLKSETRRPTLLLSHLEPVITVGARQTADQFSTGRALDLPVFEGQRGGNETWHGPGQWVGFPLTSLEHFSGDPKGVRKAQHLILDWMLAVCAEFRSDCSIQEGERLGIWTPRGKIVSLGIKIRQGCLTSGFALNVHRHATSFRGINPCGIDQALPDFLFSDPREGSLAMGRVASKILSLCPV